MFQVFLYLGIMLGVIFVWFLALKRPIYEAIFVSFIVLVAVTNKWTAILGYWIWVQTFSVMKQYCLTLPFWAVSMPKSWAKCQNQNWGF